MINSVILPYKAIEYEINIQLHDRNIIMGIYKTDTKHELKDILSLLMDECDIDDAQLARETGVPASTISRMRLNSSANPTASTLRPISKFFSVSISQLLGDEPISKERLPGTHNPTSYTSIRMPVIEWDWIMDWIENNGNSVKKQLTTWLSTEKEIDHNSFALIIPTDSFGLAFRKGSTIIVDPSHVPIDGDLVLVKNVDDHNIVLKQFLVDGNEQYIRSVNPEIKNITPLTEYNKIIGVIIETRFSLSPVEKQTAKKEAKLPFSFGISAYIKST